MVMRFDQIHQTIHLQQHLCEMSKGVGKYDYGGDYTLLICTESPCRFSPRRGAISCHSARVSPLLTCFFHSRAASSEVVCGNIRGMAKSISNGP
jgi:hypothetical protein